MMRNLLRKVRSIADNGVELITILPDYEELYEQHAKQHVEDEAVGNGDFEIIGQIELSVLKWAGMQPTSSLLDFGCGTGRLAIHAIPHLREGAYLGVDISPTMLERAQRRVDELGLAERKPVWKVETSPAFANLNDISVGFCCAFSVFTHMDAEDSLLYLQALRRVVRPGGRLVVSHLLLDESKEAQNVLVMSSTIPYRERRKRVLSVTTTRSHFETLAKLTGWRVVDWVRHDAEVFPYGPDGSSMGALGQAICLLENRSEPFGIDRP